LIPWITKQKFTEDECEGSYEKYPKAKMSPVLKMVALFNLSAGHRCSTSDYLRKYPTKSQTQVRVRFETTTWRFVAQNVYKEKSHSHH